MKKKKTQKKKQKRQKKKKKKKKKNIRVQSRRRDNLKCQERIFISCHGESGALYVKRFFVKLSFAL